MLREDERRKMEELRKSEKLLVGWHALCDASRMSYLSRVVSSEQSWENCHLIYAALEIAWWHSVSWRFVLVKSSFDGCVVVVVEQQGEGQLVKRKNFCKKYSVETPQTPILATERPEVRILSFEIFDA